MYSRNTAWVLQRGDWCAAKVWILLGTLGLLWEGRSTEAGLSSGRIPLVCCGQEKRPGVFNGTLMWVVLSRRSERLSKRVKHHFRLNITSAWCSSLESDKEAVWFPPLWILTFVLVKCGAEMISVTASGLCPVGHVDGLGHWPGQVVTDVAGNLFKERTEGEESDGVPDPVGVHVM